MTDYTLTPQQQRAIPIEDLALLILQILKRNLSAPPGSSIVHYGPNNMGAIRAFEFEDESNRRHGFPDPNFKLRFQEAQELHRQRGFIYPDSPNSDCYHLTENGQAFDSSEPGIEIATASGLIAHIESAAGRQLGQMAAAYFVEALEAWQNNRPLSCGFTLGAAAERLILKTAELVKDDLSDPATDAVYDKCGGVKAYARFIEDHLKPLRKRHPSDEKLFADLDSNIGTLYHLYRLTRNEAGHPDDTVPNLSRDDLKANLASFRSFGTAILRVWTVIE